MTKALVIFSGGQDSTTCLYWAKGEFDEVHALTFDYGQRHQREIDAALKIASMAGVKSHEVLQLGPILNGRSPLTNPAEKLETYADFPSMDRIIGNRVELTFVPMRNALFLTLAANRAVCLDCYDMVTGVCEADNANYPDCRLSFISAQAETIREALGIDRFTIHTPLMRRTKDQTIALARELGPACMAALGYSHTCYAGVYPPCGICHACVLRAEGFRVAGVDDPLVARAKREGALPDAPSRVERVG